MWWHHEGMGSSCGVSIYPAPYSLLSQDSVTTFITLPHTFFLSHPKKKAFPKRFLHQMIRHLQHFQAVWHHKGRRKSQTSDNISKWYQEVDAKGYFSAWKQVRRPCWICLVSERVIVYHHQDGTTENFSIGSTSPRSFKNGQTQVIVERAINIVNHNEPSHAYYP